MTEKYYLGVEIGGTKQQICLGYADGTILESTDVRLGQVKAPAILDWIRDTVRRYQARFPIAGIGVGFGGPLDDIGNAVEFGALPPQPQRLQ